MLKRLQALMNDGPERDAATAAAGMGALLLGRKLTGLTLFAKGCLGLEKHWREAHPYFEGDLAARWQKAVELYEGTHQDPTNRLLHMIGIPMIVGGAAGLLIMPSYTPPWLLAAGSFTTGWILNLVGHAVYEKNQPAFADDPLSFLAGPIWDLKQLRDRLTRHTPPAPIYAVPEPAPAAAN
jgi:hypothetical protein